MSGITVTAKTPFANGGDAFKVDPDDVLGIAYSRYKTTVYALALSKPALYYDGRAIIVDQIKEAAIKGIYNTIYDFLKSGIACNVFCQNNLKAFWTEKFNIGVQLNSTVFYVIASGRYVKTKKRPNF